MTADVVKVEGAATLSATLDRFAADVANMPDAQADAARRVLQDARRRAPMRTGRLASSGFSQGAAAVATVGFSARHAGPLEFGVGPRVGLRGPHNIRATHFLGDTVTADTDAVVGILTAAVDDRLSEVKGA